MSDFGKILRFGCFSLHVRERLLLNNNEPVVLGGRALDLLIAFVSRPNENLSKIDLIAQVWPGVTVEETSLRVHIAALRKALNDGEDGNRYIVTIAGRGYCFVAPVTVEDDFKIRHDLPRRPPAQGLLPNIAKSMVGRDSSLATLIALIKDSRFVTVVGAGGVGKTTLAVAVAHAMLDDFEGSVVFVDLGAINHAGLIVPSVASLLGLAVQSDDPTPSLLGYLRGKRILLVFDNCEHVIDGAASLARDIITSAPQAHVLATSREALRADGEQIYKLMPLAIPPDEQVLDANTALGYSAVQLFVERVVASGTTLSLTNEEAVVVAKICRKLDGLALAIELAAARVGTYGLPQTLALLDERLTMEWVGQRTAPPRQKSLRTMLDWSYELLSDIERIVFRRVAVFVGNFTLEAALEVVADEEVGAESVFAAIESLVAKSLIMTNMIGRSMRYRLPELTRTYALGAGDGATEDVRLSIRHGRYVRRWLRERGLQWSVQSLAPDHVSLLAEIGNVRAALEWGFSSDGDSSLAIELASAAVPLFMALSLLTECLFWSERALAVLEHNDTEEVQLQAALGMSLMFTRGNGEDARIALAKSLSIAKRLGNAVDELRALSLLHMYFRRIGDYRSALRCAEQSLSPAASTETRPAIALAHSLLGVSLYHVGDLNGAKRELEAALQLRDGTDWTSTFLLGFDHYNLSAAILARTLWLTGHPAQAVSLAKEAVQAATRMNHPLTIAIALTWALSVFIWIGDIESAEVLLKESRAHSEAHSLTPNVMQARGFRGELALLRGRIDEGLRDLRDCLKELRATRYELLSTPFSMALALGLIETGQAQQALELIDESIARIEASGEMVYMPELVRIKGRAASNVPQMEGVDAEALFLKSIALSRRSGARSWELRAATDLASLQINQGRWAQAHDQLRPVVASFAEGQDTADVRGAQQLLARTG